MAILMIHVNSYGFAIQRNESILQSNYTNKIRFCIQNVALNLS